VVSETSQAGSTSLEVVVLTPAMILLVLLLVIGGRLAETRIAVQGAARSAARSASFERTPGKAMDAAQTSAESSLKDRKLTCNPMNIVTDTGDFRPGGIVRVTVECTVDLADLRALSVGPTKLVRASFSEPIDRFREAKLP